ncbi:unnamed protein product, partial [Iphiclides podalirius]
MATLNIAQHIAYTVTCDVNARSPHVRKMVRPRGTRHSRGGRRPDAISTTQHTTTAKRFFEIRDLIRNGKPELMQPKHT